MTYKRRKEKELEDMRDIMKNPDREQRWKQIAKSAYAYDPDWAERRRRKFCRGGVKNLKEAIIENGRVLCPYCNKLNLKVDGTEVIKNLKIRCRGSLRQYKSLLYC